MARSEAARLKALRDYDVLDTPAEETFDRLTGLAADLFGTPIALVSLIDSDRQWFKSRVGLDACSTPRSMAFCDHAIGLGPNATMVVEDASTDQRFADNPLVTGDPNIRFYAGAVLTSPDGANLGTLCVIDRQVRPTPCARDLERLRVLAKIVVDELELRRTARAAVEKQRLLEMAENLSAVGRWRYNVADGRFVSSEVVHRIHGVPSLEYHPSLPEVLPHYHEDDRDEFARIFGEALTTGVGYEFELRIIRPDGEVRDVVSKAECLLDDSGRTSAIYGVFQDITEQKQLIAGLRAEQAATAAARDAAEELARRASVAEAVAGLGHWRRDMRTHEVTWSEELFRIYELETRVPLSFDEVVAMTHPDDRLEVEQRLRTKNEALEAGIARAEQTYRIITAKGETRYISSSATPERNAAGEITALVGAVQDVTRHVLAEQTLSESEARYRALADNAPDMVVQVSVDGILTYVSPACEAIIGFTSDEMLGKSVSSFLSDDSADTRQALIEGKGPSSPDAPLEFALRHKSGRQVWLEGRPRPLKDPVTGRVIGWTDCLRDITGRRTLESQLRHARAEAETAAAVKAEFLANMSHELRTPLTSIIGFTALAAEQPDLTPRSRGYVERVADASRALLCSVNDILDFSQLEAGQVRLVRKPVSVAQLGRETLDLFSPQASAKDLTLVFEAAEDLVISADPDRIRQVLLNLVGNAVKFTQAGGVTLGIRYDQTTGRLYVEVADTGEGVAPEKQDRLFRRFSQIDGSLTRAHGGTGLGLAICKGLVEAMDGEIGVHSVLGEGSRFWFEIPAPITNLPAPVSQQAGSAALPLAGMRLLVVDDHPANRELARLILEGVGVEITEAVNGLEAVNLAAAWPFDLILMDLRMPTLDGFEALRHIRQGGGPNDTTPILAFTADASPDMAQKWIAQGFEAVITKPIDPLQLMTVIAGVLAGDTGGGDEGHANAA